MSIDEQEVFELDDEPMIAAPSEKHLACVLLLDTSGSMSGAAIEQLNHAVNQFKAKVSLDDTAKNCVDIAIITFSSSVKVVQNFVPVMEMDSVNLVADGGTSMGAGLSKALEMIKARNRFYDDLGTPVFKPWIFVVSDGVPTDSIDAISKQIKAEDEKGKLKVIALGVKGYDKKSFTSFTHRILELADYNFDKIFDWLAASMVTISVSKVANESGDNVELAELPSNSRIVPRGW